MTVHFRDGTTIDYTPPTSTLDPRYKACTDHRVACDCREAEKSEDHQELRAEQKRVAMVTRDVVGDHPTYMPGGRPGCMCTGCKIVRVLAGWGYPVPVNEGADQ